MSTRCKPIATVMIVLILVVGCGKPEPTTTPVPTPAPTRVAPTSSNAAWDDRAIFRQGLIEAEQEALDRLPGASVYHIDLQIPDDYLLLNGHEEVRYTNQEDEPLNEVYFRLFPNTAGGKATVSEVKVNDQDVQPVYEFQDSALRVPLPAALQPDEQVVIGMDFEVEVAQEMAGNYGLFGYFDGVLALDEFYPVIPVYDDEGTGPEPAEGWNVEVPPPNGDVTYFDASFYLVRVTAPASLTIVASGVVVGSEYEAGKQILTLAAGPARDFYLAASENYIVSSETVGETTVNSYAFSERADGAELALQFAADALRSFNERFGVYPYTEFDVVSTPMQALGMEYPGTVAIGLNLYDPNEKAAGLPFPIVLESTVAHEVAHQWFYNTVGNDQIDEPWLDEALAQYLTGLYYTDTHGEGAARDYRTSWDNRWGSVDRADVPIGLPVGAYTGKEYGPIVYGRGPLFIAALAKEMGQEPFDEFLRDYYQSHKWGIGTSEAFRRLAERHCQCDLTALFEEWVYEKTATPVPSTATPPPTATPAPPTATPTPATPASDGVVQGWAVLAQKDDYSDVDMTNILVDHIGVTQMRQVLDDSGWNADHIHELREFDRETLQDNLDWLAENADQDDIVFLYVAAHGMYLKKVLAWDTFFAADWEQIPSYRRLLVIDSCQAANYTDAVSDDPSPHLSIAAVAGDEYAWSGLEEEGLPIIGGVFTHYFAAAFDDAASLTADTDGNGLVSVQEAALMAEGQQRAYMHDVVFAVPEFVQMYHDIGAFPDEDPAFPHVVVDDAIGEPLYLGLPTPAVSEAASSKEIGGLRITIVYDNIAYDTRLRAEWGFAALIEYGDHTLLFDTGGDSPTLLGNMDKLGLDLQPIEAVALSHIHDDHVGGLQGLLDTGISPTVYVPAAFPASFKDSVRARTDLVEVTDPLEIFPGVHSTGQLSGRVIEQGLIVETSEGLVVITGCAHPGVVQMVRRAKEIMEDEVALVIGGFHLGEYSQSQIRRIIAYFRELGVKQVSPTHCTGERAIAMFADEYGDDYIEGGVGRVIEKD